MAEKTRSSIMTGVMGILHVFNTRRGAGTGEHGDDGSPTPCSHGKWVIVNMAPAESGDWPLVAAGWKYLVPRVCCGARRQDSDRRGGDLGRRYAQFVNSYDANYLAQCRFIWAAWWC